MSENTDTPIGTEIMRAQTGGAVTRSLSSQQVVEALFKSGYFTDVKSMAQAYTKVLVGEEYGLTPFAAMSGITIIKGRLGFMSNLLATFVQESGRFKYRVKSSTSESCTIEFYEGDELLGESTWTIADSETAGLMKGDSNHAKYPKAMMFNRALSAGVRMFCPSVTNGTPVYTPDELGAQVDESGAAVNVTAPDEPDGVVVEAEVVRDQSEAARLAEAYELAGMTLDELNIALGSIGASAFDPTVPLAEQFARLSVEHYEALYELLAERVSRELDRLDAETIEAEQEASEIEALEDERQAALDFEGAS